MLCCSSWGYPPPRSGNWVPPPGAGKGVPPTWTWKGGTPGPGKGVPPTWTWEGGTPPGPGKGLPPLIPSPIEVWADTQSETITFPHPSDAGGKNGKKSSSQTWQILPWVLPTLVCTRRQCWPMEGSTTKRTWTVCIHLCVSLVLPDTWRYLYK